VSERARSYSVLDDDPMDVARERFQEAVAMLVAHGQSEEALPEADFTALVLRLGTERWEAAGGSSSSGGGGGGGVYGEPQQAKKDGAGVGAESTGVMPLPSAADLTKAFILADADDSGMVDEKEFLALYELVLAGKVLGLGAMGQKGAEMFEDGLAGKLGTKTSRQMKEERARAGFRARAGEDAELSSDGFREVVVGLHREGTWAGDAPLPSDEDLAKAFVLADTDGSGMVDEKEFMVLFNLVLDGAVAGLGAKATDGTGGKQARGSVFAWGGGAAAKKLAQRRDEAFLAAVKQKGLGTAERAATLLTARDRFLTRANAWEGNELSE